MNFSNPPRTLIFSTTSTELRCARCSRSHRDRWKPDAFAFIPFVHSRRHIKNQGETVSPENSNTSRIPNPFSSSSSRRFEQPDVRSLAMYTVCCATIYPFLYAVTLLCRGRSLFEVRLLVALGCTTVAFAMGFFLLKFAKRFIEATSKFLVCSQQWSQMLKLRVS